MLSFLYNSLVNKKSVHCSLKSTHLCFLNQSYRFFSENVQSEINDGKNDSVQSLFRTYGFDQTQISSLFSKSPLLLSLNKDETKPKLDFFSSYGFSSSDLCQILTLHPEVLRYSLEDRIIPSCVFLKGILKDNVSVVAATKRAPWLVRQNLRTTLSSNIELLRNYGVPDYRISALLKAQPRKLIQSTHNFKILVEEAKEMGFEPEKSHFVKALHVTSALSKSTRERKWDLFRKWGWSDAEILSAFRHQPCIMFTSEEKIERVMDFLVNKMGWDASQVSSCPQAVMHSLDTWTTPRCLVVQFLLSKGLVKENLALCSFIVLRGDKFRPRFVDKFCVEFPQVLTLYDNTVK